MSDQVAHAASHRWAVLASYGLLAACTQLLWLTFAPIDTAAATAMHTDAGSVGDLAVVFPLLYIVLALPTGRWLDARFGPRSKQVRSRPRVGHCSGSWRLPLPGALRRRPPHRPARPQ